MVSDYVPKRLSDGWNIIRGVWAPQTTATFIGIWNGELRNQKREMKVLLFLTVVSSLSVSGMRISSFKFDHNRRRTRTQWSIGAWSTTDSWLSELFFTNGRYRLKTARPSGTFENWNLSVTYRILKFQSSVYDNAMLLRKRSFNHS